MLNAYYSNTINGFSNDTLEHIIGCITKNNKFDISSNTIDAWQEEIIILKNQIKSFSGEIHFEFSVPRMGKRIDCLLIINNIVFILEFKVGETEFHSYHKDQVWDYALDLKNFHKPSHDAFLIPILIATQAEKSFTEISFTSHNDKLASPILIGKNEIFYTIKRCCELLQEETFSFNENYLFGSYSPTPTIVEAAVKLYSEHTVEDITRSDADAKNLKETTDTITHTIEFAKSNNKKIICFVTGVPGAGKTLVGLKVATTHLDKSKGNTSVFLSGNAPLVSILQEALTRDKVEREKQKGNKITKSTAKEGVKAFIQIIHHYRDAYLIDKKAPYDHVAIFDEAQRAWNKEQTIDFMKKKKGQPNFNWSEPEFLISCLDRHDDWAVIVCLVGGGQEINTGEAGISEWIFAISNSFPHWEIKISPNLIDKEYDANKALELAKLNCKLTFDEDLHLSVSMRSYRAENVSKFVKQLLDIDVENAKSTLNEVLKNYPIVLTRDLSKAKGWLKEKARGSERYGIVVSSQAQRLRPLAIDVRVATNPVNWFLDGKNDVRSSYYLEDVATEFQVQGLELDWACITWDGDFRYGNKAWNTYSFVGSKWQNIHKTERKKYLLNAYRVLLTRARQGMIIVVPNGNNEDATRLAEYYDTTYFYLESLGIPVLK
ncbi:MAG: DUF2075 domain-containing protein [Chitinophagaceae bacterium]